MRYNIDYACDGCEPNCNIIINGIEDIDELDSYPEFCPFDGHKCKWNKREVK
jgi:hypothetical protein